MSVNQLETLKRHFFLVFDGSWWIFLRLSWVSTFIIPFSVCRLVVQNSLPPTMCFISFPMFGEALHNNVSGEFFFQSQVLQPTTKVTSLLVSLFLVGMFTWTHTSRKIKTHPASHVNCITNNSKNHFKYASNLLQSRLPVIDGLYNLFLMQRGIV